MFARACLLPAIRDSETPRYGAGVVQSQDSGLGHCVRLVQNVQYHRSLTIPPRRM
jgi:hypothetical protein